LPFFLHFMLLSCYSCWLVQLIKKVILQIDLIFFYFKWISVYYYTIIN
jgi:hypothetical protein